MFGEYGYSEHQFKKNAPQDSHLSWGRRRTDSCTVHFCVKSHHKDPQTEQERDHLGAGQASLRFRPGKQRAATKQS